MAFFLLSKSFYGNFALILTTPNRPGLFTRCRKQAAGLRPRRLSAVRL